MRNPKNDHKILAREATRRAIDFLQQALFLMEKDHQPGAGGREMDLAHRNVLMAQEHSSAVWYASEGLR